MKVEIVKFKDGTYAVRKKTWFGSYKYLDKDAGDPYWWDRDHMPYAKVTLEEARELHKAVFDIGTPIED